MIRPLPRLALFLAALVTLGACAGGTDRSGDDDVALALPPGESLPSGPLQCVPYARHVSGIQIRGDAWTWWNQAARGYKRGSRPEIGAVLVFKRSDRLRHGHVSVVSHRIGHREIMVTHANWGSTSATRGRVTRNVRVLDVSPRNDWTAVRVWYAPSGNFGQPYPTHGFIYPNTPPPGLSPGDPLPEASTDPATVATKIAAPDGG